MRGSKPTTDDGDDDEFIARMMPSRARRDTQRGSHVSRSKRPTPVEQLDLPNTNSPQAQRNKKSKRVQASTLPIMVHKSNRLLCPTGHATLHSLRSVENLEVTPCGERSIQSTPYAHHAPAPSTNIKHQHPTPSRRTRIRTSHVHPSGRQTQHVVVSPRVDTGG